VGAIVVHEVIVYVNRAHFPEGIKDCSHLLSFGFWPRFAQTGLLSSHQNTNPAWTNLLKNTSREYFHRLRAL
jgi:hypothetical protein